MTEPQIERRVGVEEEFLLADPISGAIRPVSRQAMRAVASRPSVTGRTPGGTHRGELDGIDRLGQLGHLQPSTRGRPQIQLELFEEQLETATVPCVTLADLEAGLREGRRLAAAAAEAAGAAIAAIGTSAVAGAPAMRQCNRCRQMADSHGRTTRDNLICATHIHVEVTSDDEAVTALDGIRPWLPILLALSANSPFWRGEDTGYASFRAQVVRRWPSAGPTEPFHSAANYHVTVAELIRTTAALDEAMIYFDARLAVNYPTLEIRIADVCTELTDTLLIAALARALVETALEGEANRTVDSRNDRCGGSAVPAVPTVPGPPNVPVWRTELLRAATWKASRWGLSQELIDPIRREPRPALDVLDDLVDHVRPALDSRGEASLVTALIDDLRDRGTGSVRQRAVFSHRSRSADVMRDVIERTKASHMRPL